MKGSSSEQGDYQSDSRSIEYLQRNPEFARAFPTIIELEWSWDELHTIHSVSRSIFGENIALKDSIALRTISFTEEEKKIY
jgi:hypothetical protein